MRGDIFHFCGLQNGFNHYEVEKKIYFNDDSIETIKFKNLKVQECTPSYSQNHRFAEWKKFKGDLWRTSSPTSC